MIAPQDPPGFIVRTEAQKAAWDNGFRVERGIEAGGWLRYASTTAKGEIWLAGVSPPLDREPGIDDPESRSESRAPGRQMRNGRRVAHRTRLP